MSDRDMSDRDMSDRIGDGMHAGIRDGTSRGSTTRDVARHDAPGHVPTDGFRPWDVVHVELSEPPVALEVAPGRAGALVVGWWKGIPIAAEELPADRLPMTARQLRALLATLAAPTVAAYLADAARAGVSDGAADGTADGAGIGAVEAPLARLHEVVKSAPASREPISVIVCTRDRPEQLARCLDSLAALRPRPMEVVVVDNAPDRPATRALCEAVGREERGVRYVPESRPGLSVARNTGIRASRGRIVAFTDDDVVVHPAWLDELRRAFADPRTGLVTGLVLPVELETESQWSFESEFGGFGRRLQPATHGAEFLHSYIGGGAPVWLLGAGANMAFRRATLDDAGDFDERLGAGAAGCSEDSELWYRVLARGWTARYHPAAVVFHEHRRTGGELSSQLRAYMRGHVAALLVQYERHRHWGNLWRLGVGLPWHYARVAAGTVARRDRRRRRLLLTEVAGCLAGIGYYARSRDMRSGTTQGRGRRGDHAGTSARASTRASTGEDAR